MARASLNHELAERGIPAPIIRDVPSEGPRETKEPQDFIPQGPYEVELPGGVRMKVIPERTMPREDFDKLRPRDQTQFIYDNGKVLPPKP